MKLSPKPEKYNLKPEDFDEWKELFVAMMCAMDTTWGVILGSKVLSMNKSLAK